MTTSAGKEALERPAKEIVYPVRDGKPVGETDAHVDLTLLGKEVLRNFLLARTSIGLDYWQQSFLLARLVSKHSLKILYKEV